MNKHRIILDGVEHTKNSIRFYRWCAVVRKNVLYEETVGDFMSKWFKNPDGGHGYYKKGVVNEERRDKLLEYGIEKYPNREIVILNISEFFPSTIHEDYPNCEHFDIVARKIEGIEYPEYKRYVYSWHTTKELAEKVVSPMKKEMEKNDIFWSSSDPSKEVTHWNSVEVMEVTDIQEIVKTKKERSENK